MKMSKTGATPQKLGEHSKVVLQQFQNFQKFAFKAALRTFPSICEFSLGAPPLNPGPHSGSLSSDWF